MYKICIDPGHGGKDPGATNGSVYEKNITLEIAKKLEAKLKAVGVYNVYMTRTTDVYDSPYEKAVKANNFGADYFISIHCNSASMSSANGIETFAYLGNTASTNLAKAVQSKLIDATGLTNRGVKFNNRLTVLNSTKMPAILVESGFINNPVEVTKLQSASFQNAVASAIVDGLNEFLNVKNVTTPVTEEPNKEEAVEQVKTDFEEAKLAMMALGITDGSRPNDYATRNEIWAMMNRLIDKLGLDE